MELRKKTKDSQMECPGVPFIIDEADVGEYEQQWDSYYHTAELDLSASHGQCQVREGLPTWGLLRTTSRMEEQSRTPASSVREGLHMSLSLPIPANR